MNTNERVTGEDAFWPKLAELDPEEVCAHAGASFLENVSLSDSGSAGVYEIEFLYRTYRVDAVNRIVAGPDGGIVDGEPALLLLSYLVLAKEVDLVGEWISEKQIPGGSLFFQGPHAIPVAPIAGRYGNDPKALIKRGLALGGDKGEYGDASVFFTALPRIPVGFVLWEQDDEFPASVTVMFDRSIGVHFPVDVVLALVGSIVRVIVAVQ